MPTVRDQALCVRCWEFSETSQTVALYTRENGLVRALAKGSRRERAPFSGGLEAATRGEMVAIIKPGGSLATLTAWDLQETYRLVRSALPRFHAGLYVADALAHGVQELDPHPELFDAADLALTRIGGVSPWPEEALGECLARFLLSLLDQTGHRPELRTDAATGSPLPEGAATVAYDPRLGGLTADDGRDATRWRVRAETAEALAMLQGKAGGSGSAPVVPPPVAVRGARLLDRVLAWTLGRELPASEGVFGPAGHA